LHISSPLILEASAATSEGCPLLDLAEASAALCRGPHNTISDHDANIDAHHGWPAKTHKWQAKEEPP